MAAKNQLSERRSDGLLASISAQRPDRPLQIENANPAATTTTKRRMSKRANYSEALRDSATQEPLRDQQKRVPNIDTERTSRILMFNALANRGEN